MNKILLIVYNMLLLLVPVTLNFYGFTYSKLIFFYSILVFLYLTLTKKINKNIFFQNKTFKYLSIGYLLFFIVVVVSFLINKITNSQNKLLGFVDLLRVLEYYLVLTNYFVLLSKENFKSFNISLIIIICLTAILSFFQFYNIFGLNEYYIKKIAPTQYITLVNDYPDPRTLGLAGNPNVFGFLMTLFSIYFLYNIFKDKKKWYNYFLYFLVVIVLFHSSSRTSYITLIMSNLCLGGLFFLKLNKKDFFKTTVVCFSLIVVHLLFLFILPDSYTWRVKTLVDFRNQNSYEKRMEQNRENLFKYMEEGNLDVEDTGTFDNEWMILLFKYSIVGIVVFIIMMIIPIKTIRDNKEFCYPIYISLVIATFVYMLVAASYHSYLLFNITMLFTAVSLNIKQNMVYLPEGK